MKNLTKQQLADQARKYDHVQNEGGEGYNPYREELERREMAEEFSRPKNRAERKYRIRRELERKDCALARECGTYNQAEIDGLKKELQDIEDQEEAEFIAEWTVEETMARRKEWNNFVRSLINDQGKIDGPSMVKITQREIDQGWTSDDLKAAIKIHNL